MIAIDRLKEIQSSIHASGGWWSCEIPEEKREIHAAWDAMPGHFTFYDAVSKMLADARVSASRPSNP